ncbi:hypothetical protein ABMA28_009427 [Loxostege sticticalis]|uniref:Uncharacterized protein n=1 Tax=Loxostege sticticalis TaxID=481309 RepID=A0ABD0SFB2_LOXSC
MMDLLAKQTQTIESVATQVSTLASQSDRVVSNLDESFESVPDSTTDEEFGVPSLNVLPQEEDPIPTSALPDVLSEEAILTAQIAEAQRKLAALKAPATVSDCDFSPNTTEAELKLTQADPILADQGRRCQQLNEEGWKNIRYADVQEMFHTTPVFSALKVNSHLATITPSWSSMSQFEKSDLTLGVITYGLLLQRKAFQEACQKIDTKTRSEIHNHMLAADGLFKKISDGLLQYTCGRRPEIIQARRESYKPANKVLSEMLHDVPPSDTHLFCEEKLSEIMKDQGGAHNFFPNKTSPTYKTGRKSSGLKRTKKEYGNGNKIKKPTRNFRDFRTKQDIGTSGPNRARTTHATTKKP